MRFKRFTSWHIVLILIFVLILFFSLRKIYDVDIGFHLRGGEWIITNKSFHHYDQYTYTVPQNEYIAMSWLYQVILYLIFKLGRDTFISIFNSIIILIIFFLIYLRLKKYSIPLFLICIILLIGTIPFEIRFGVRPELFTYLFMVSMLLILDLYYDHKGNYLFLLPIIQLFWVNFHGLFILGWVIIGSYLIDTFFTKKSHFKELLKWTAISIFISLLNPYHIKGVLFPFYLFTRLQNASIFKDTITEFASPFSARGFLLTSHSALFSYYIFLGVSLLLLILTRPFRRMYEYLLFIAFGYLSFTAVRNIPLFIIIGLQIMGLGINDLIKNKKKIFLSKVIENAIPILLIIFLILFIIWIKNDGYYAARGGGNFGVGFDPIAHPIKACEFIKENKLNGRILNDLNRGSWLIWSVREPVYIDGRLEVIKEPLFTEFHYSHQPGGVLNLIEKYKPSLIIFDYSYPEALFWEMDLENSPDWRIIYWDETSVIYAKKGYREDIKPIVLSSVIKGMGLKINFTEEEKWRILRKPDKSGLKLFIEGLLKKQYYPLALTRMAFYASVRLDFPTAEILYLNALSQTDYHCAEIYFRLGLIYHFMQDYNKAEYCYRRTLRGNPSHKKAREMLDRLRVGKLPVGG